MALLPARPVDLRAQGEGVVEYPGKVACPSGRRCSTRNAVWCHSHPGFKSQRYRHCRPAPLGPGGFVMPSWCAVLPCCFWPRWCSGRRRARPPARLGGLTSFGAAPRSPPVPSGPSGALHTSGARSLMLLGALACCLARPRRRRSISHVILLRLVQTLNLHRWNCNVFGVCRKMTTINYVRNLGGGGVVAARGRRDQALSTGWPGCLKPLSPLRAPAEL